MDRRAVVLEPLTIEAFRPYGQVVVGGMGPRHFFRSGLDVWTLPFASDALLRLQVMRYHRQRLRVRRLERHVAVTETRIAIGTSRGVLVVAGDAETPRPDAVRAFLLDGRAGVMLRPGIWHGLDCFPVGADVADFLFLSDERTEEEIERLSAPVSGERTHVLDCHEHFGAEFEVVDPNRVAGGELS